jgi:hypothetical protein
MQRTAGQIGGVGVRLVGPGTRASRFSPARLRQRARQRRLEAERLRRYERAHATALGWIRPRVPAGGPWSKQVVATLSALVDFTAGAPREARVLFVEGPWGGHRCFQRHQLDLETAAAQLRRGRHLAPTRLSPELEFLTACGVASLLANRLQSAEPVADEKLLSDLIDFVFEPYLPAVA